MAVYTDVRQAAGRVELAAQNVGATVQDSQEKKSIRGTKGGITEKLAEYVSGAETEKKIAALMENEKSQSISTKACRVAEEYKDSWVEEQKIWLKDVGVQAEKTCGRQKSSGKEEKMAQQQRELDALKKMVDRMRESQKRAMENEKKRKKNFQYNYSKVSRAINQAKTSTQASGAVGAAYNNLSFVRRAAASGKYKEDEIKIAIMHARKMVRIAQKKVRNVKMEAVQQKRHRDKERSAKNVIRADIYPVVKNQEKMLLHRMKKDMDQMEKRQKNSNRRQENLELMMADMQYIKRKIELLENQTPTAAAFEGTKPMDMMGETVLSGMAKVEQMTVANQATENQQTNISQMI